MLENCALSLKGNVENISIMVKTHGQTRAQQESLEAGQPPKKKKVEEAGKHLQMPRSDSITFPYHRGAEIDQEFLVSSLHMERRCPVWET